MVRSTQSHTKESTKFRHGVVGVSHFQSSDPLWCGFATSNLSRVPPTPLRGAHRRLGPPAPRQGGLAGGRGAPRGPHAARQRGARGGRQRLGAPQHALGVAALAGFPAPPRGSDSGPGAGCKCESRRTAIKGWTVVRCELISCPECTAVGNMLRAFSRVGSACLYGGAR